MPAPLGATEYVTRQRIRSCPVFVVMVPAPDQLPASGANPPSAGSALRCAELGETIMREAPTKTAGARNRIERGFIAVRRLLPKQNIQSPRSCLAAFI